MLVGLGEHGSPVERFVGGDPLRRLTMGLAAGGLRFALADFARESLSAVAVTGSQSWSFKVGRRSCRQ